MSVGSGEHPSESVGAERPPGRPTGQISLLDQALWKQFQEAASESDFIQAWLALQCRLIPGVDAGVAVLAEAAGGPFAPAAYWPDRESCSPALADTAEIALAEKRESCDYR